MLNINRFATVWARNLSIILHAEKENLNEFLEQ
ncbi:MAG: hypothetical protein ACJARP_002970 [Vicingaceae bacterium]